MDESQNPYASPEITDDMLVAESAETNTIPITVDADLASTRPWVIVTAVCFLAMGCLMCIVMFLALLYDGVPDDAFMLIFIVIVLYAIVGTILVTTGVLLLRCSRNIKRYLLQSNTRSLERVLEASVTFWRFAGIVTLLGALLFAVTMCVAIGTAL